VAQFDFIMEEIIDTKKQVEFVLGFTDDDNTINYWEIYKHDIRRYLD